MPLFRSSSSHPAAAPTADGVRAIIAGAMRPGNCFVGPGLRLEWTCAPEEVHWELFRGRALDHAQTRRRQAFEAWSIVDASDPPGGEPLLSVKFDPDAPRVFVTRSVRCRTWEGYVEGGQALSRETVRRVRELVGAVDLERLASAAELHDELIALLFLAVVGTSRLPLTSLEAPLPEFIFGQLAYCYRPKAEREPIQSINAWLDSLPVGEMSPREISRGLETAIRATPADRIAPLAGALPGRLRDLSTFRAMFNDIALSPYTDFVTRTLALLQELVRVGSITPVGEVDLLTHLLRQIGRHLTSFDLVKFHHRGANYPDALLLEEIAARVWELAEAHPDHFLPRPADPAGEAKAKRLRRRAVRQAWLLWRQYRGHPVPDAPTSPGENARVLPIAPVPDEQIMDLGKRTRRLFADSGPLDAPPAAVGDVLRQCVIDLREPAEMLELGTGLFLDRPLGFAKARGEPDATLLLSHEAFSRGVAEARRQLLRELHPDVPPFEIDEQGIRWFSRASRQRPGVVSVQDAQLAADDFVYLRTTRSAVRQLFEQYQLDTPATRWMLSERSLILPSPDEVDVLQVYDAAWRLRLRLRMDASAGYFTRAGTECLAGGMAVLAAWDERGQAVARATSIRIMPREIGVRDHAAK